MDWQSYFINLAEEVSKKSKDPSTKVGAVIVGPDGEIRSTGYNGFPRGFNDDTEGVWERPTKYEYIIHAETNAIFNAARCGTSVKGCWIYLNWIPYPCQECTKAIIQSGIIGVCGPDRPFLSSSTKNRVDWESSFGISKIMMNECGIKYIINR